MRFLRVMLGLLLVVAFFLSSSSFLYTAIILFEGELSILWGISSWALILIIVFIIGNLLRKKIDSLLMFVSFVYVFVISLLFSQWPWIKDLKRELIGETSEMLLFPEIALTFYLVTGSILLFYLFKRWRDINQENLQNGAELVDINKVLRGQFVFSAIFLGGVAILLLIFVEVLPPLLIYLFEEVLFIDFSFYTGLILGLLFLLLLIFFYIAFSREPQV